MMVTRLAIARSRSSTSAARAIVGVRRGQRSPLVAARHDSWLIEQQPHWFLGARLEFDCPACGHRSRRYDARARRASNALTVLGAPLTVNLIVGARERRAAHDELG
jgi:hypothetical protein